MNPDLPVGWRVGEPLGDDEWWRCIERGTVVDGRPTRQGAERRCRQIVEDRERARNRFLRREP